MAPLTLGLACAHSRLRFPSPRRASRTRSTTRRRSTPVYSLTGICSVRYIRIMLVTLGALAESNRLHIVELLRDGPRSVGEITEQLRLRQPQVSKHLRVLSQAGFVEVHPVAQQRIYQLRSQPFHELDVWLESYRHIWNARFDRLETYLQDVQRQEQEEV